VTIITVCVLAWSAATAACGLAGNFASLMLARVLVGCGEAGGIAPSMSVVSDLFPARQRAMAMSIFGLGASLGIVVAPLVGGVLVSLVGWRWTFLTLGLVGAPIALLLILAVREPRRGQVDGVMAGAATIGFTTAFIRLFRRPSYALIILAFVFVSLAQFATLLWLPAFFQRSYGVAAADLGAKLSFYQGLPLLAGSLLGGVLADWLSRRDQRWLAWMPTLTALLTAPIMLGLFAVRSEALALALLSAPSFAQGLSVGPSYALVQNLAAVHSRATSTAILAFCVTLIGASLGPLLLGMLSQLLSVRFGEESLRYAFFTVGPIYLAVAATFFLASGFLRGDLEDAQRDSEGALPTAN
jgi:MFS family permease